MSKHTHTLAVGSALIAALGVTGIEAGENPFAATPLASGYMVADSHMGKGMEGRCGEGKCGAAMMDADKDGKVSKDEFMKGHEEMFGMKDANKDGMLDKDEMSKMMGPEGKCGEGKCGAGMMKGK
jgi:uncharacterized low-complexity protein